MVNHSKVNYERTKDSIDKYIKSDFKTKPKKSKLNRINGTKLRQLEDSNKFEEVI